MTIEHALGVVLIAIPAIIFLILLRAYIAKKGNMPSDATGAVLVYHSYECITSIALLLSMALMPELIVKVGEFKVLVPVLAIKAAWSAFHRIYSEVT